MEFFVILLILYFLGWIFNDQTNKQQTYDDMWKGSSSSLSIIETSIKEHAKDKKGLTILDIEGKGVLPNKYTMNLQAALYIYDKDTRYPFLSNFEHTDESPNSRVFRSNINFGKAGPGSYYKNKATISKVILEGIEHPYKGSRNIEFTTFFYDADYPPEFRNGEVINGTENIIHFSTVRKLMSFDEPGYMDEVENADLAKSLMVEIAMQMAMSDGSLDKSEGEIIQRWIKNKVDASNAENKKELKKRLNDSLESSYKKLSSGEGIEKVISNFNELASKNLKYQLIEFCLDVLSADGVADEEELKNLEQLTKKIGLNFEEVQKMKDKTLVKIDTKFSSGGKAASDELLVSMNTDLTKDEALRFIKKEYRKWNGRLNTIEQGKERDNAQRMLDALARLREKYEKE